MNREVLDNRQANKDFWASLFFMKASVRRFFHGLDSDGLTLDELHAYWDFMKREELEEFIASLPPVKSDNHMDHVNRAALIKRLRDPKSVVVTQEKQEKGPNPYIDMFKGDDPKKQKIIQGKPLL